MAAVISCKDDDRRGRQWPCITNPPFDIRIIVVPTSETVDAGRWVDDSGKWHKRPADAAMQRAAFEHIAVGRQERSVSPVSGH